MGKNSGKKMPALSQSPLTSTSTSHIAIYSIQKCICIIVDQNAQKIHERAEIAISHSCAIKTLPELQGRHKGHAKKAAHFGESQLSRWMDLIVIVITIKTLGKI